jgi:hypothetical protein
LCLKADPGEVTVEDIQDMVRENALPDWVGHALTEGQNSDAAAAVAPAAADDGEVVTSRNRSLPIVDGLPADLSDHCGQHSTSAHGVRGARTQLMCTNAATESAGTSAPSHASMGSGADVDDDMKHIIVRTVNGMKAQEGQRFKEHLKAMQDKWKESTEKHIGELQAVIQQYQVRRQATAVLAPLTQTHLSVVPPWLSRTMTCAACSEIRQS